MEFEQRRVVLVADSHGAFYEAYTCCNLGENGTGNRMAMEKMATEKKSTEKMAQL